MMRRGPSARSCTHGGSRSGDWTAFGSDERLTPPRQLGLDPLRQVSRRLPVGTPPMAMGGLLRIAAPLELGIDAGRVEDVRVENAVAVDVVGLGTDQPMSLAFVMDGSRGAAE